MLTVNRVKHCLNNKLGNNVRVICNGSRNKREEYYGKIKETYNNIFVIELRSNDKKSFCYSDVITKRVRIYFDNNS